MIEINLLPQQYRTKETASPSLRLRKPWATMAVWWTKTSGPFSRVMKP